MWVTWGWQPPERTAATESWAWDGLPWAGEPGHEVTFRRNVGKLSSHAQDWEELAERQDP